ncbi:MAG TPA: hypothetical protein PLS77_12960 [Anaerolineaceae bacterium]|nr:hypothetical protein [Anaerolineaceae bacterium]HOH21510.1 hypothetical protein [Anaerolineaceae bacterium]HPA34429.1 hypothetical protein [Anaerolineaceae bacterium]HQH36606.1 hypothetical protein [Anaerolineaceae bacterium]HQO98838.1 hypothetical protein [Anaerolineaceae bacterium]
MQNNWNLPSPLFINQINGLDMTSLPKEKFPTASTIGRTSFSRIAIRIGIPVLVFLVVIGGTYLVAKGEYLIAAALAVIPLAVLFLEMGMRWNEIYPVMIIFSALFLKLGFSTGRSSQLVLSLVVATGLSFLWIFQMFLERRVRFNPPLVTIPVFLFCFSTLFSLVWGIVFRDPLVSIWGSFPFVQIASTLVIIISVMTMVLTGNLIKKTSTLALIVILFIIGGVMGLIRNFTKFQLPINCAGLYAMWAVALASSMAFFHHNIPLIVRGLLLVFSALWLYWGFGVNITWLAGWVPLFFVIVVVGYLRSPKLAIFLLVLLVILVITNYDYLVDTIELENRISGSTRVSAWEQNWVITKDHLLFGTGPAGYAVYYMTYFPNRAMATHNNYLDMLSQIGIVGCIFMFWFFGAILWKGWKLVQRLRGQRNFMEALAAACLAGTLGGMMMMFFGDWLFPFAYTQSIAGFDYSVYNWIFMGVILAMDQMTLPGEKQNA